jgi:hypothetical protein
MAMQNQLGRQLTYLEKLVDAIETVNAQYRSGNIEAKEAMDKIHAILYQGAVK